LAQGLVIFYKNEGIRISDAVEKPNSVLHT